MLYCFVCLVEKVVEENKPNVKIYETKHTRTTIIYKDDSVPYTTMLLNFIKSTYGSSTESQKQEDDDEKWADWRKNQLSLFKNNNNN